MSWINYDKICDAETKLNRSVYYNLQHGSADISDGTNNNWVTALNVTGRGELESFNYIHYNATASTPSLSIRVTIDGSVVYYAACEASSTTNYTYHIIGKASLSFYNTYNYITVKTKGISSDSYLSYVNRSDYVTLLKTFTDGSNTVNVVDDGILDIGERPWGFNSSLLIEVKSDTVVTHSKKLSWIYYTT